MKVVVVFLSLFVTLALQGQSDSFITQCGDLKTFSVDPDYGRKYGLPEISFDLQYPSYMVVDPTKTGQRNYNYNSFFTIDKDSVRTDRVAIGNYVMQGDASIDEDILNMSLINQFANMYEANFELSNQFKGKKTFDGKEFYMFQATGRINRPEAKFDGIYQIQAMLIRPIPTAETGVVFIFQSNENSGITSLDDIGKKGCSSIIWQSLNFK